MKNSLKRLLALAAVTALTAAVPAPSALAQPPPGGGIRARIEAVPGMRLLGERPAPPGQVVLDLAYRQPADHRHPERGSFEQRLTLVHK
ncbi:aminopeptidase, partial [Streptomyces xanthophaeus]